MLSSLCSQILSQGVMYALKRVWGREEVKTAYSIIHVILENSYKGQHTTISLMPYTLVLSEMWVGQRKTGRQSLD